MATTYYHIQKGFTLIELMISLVLGLLISAAALQIFYTTSVNSRRQEASSQIQDNAIFGFSQLQKHIRRANYGAKPNGSYDEYFMNHLTPQGGIVLTAPVKSGSSKWIGNNLSGLVLDGSTIPTDLLTKNAAASSLSNLKGIANSDQLTIQYQIDEPGSFTCEGTVIPSGFYVIERYFVRMDNSASPQTPGLACASAIYNYNETNAGSDKGIDIKEYILPGETAAKSNKLSGSGTIIISGVDYFRVMLGISDSKGFATYPENTNISYIPIPEANKISERLLNKRIVSIQIGLLTRSNNPTATPRANADLRFNILDKTNASLNDTTNKDSTYLRNVYESTVLLRNARGGV